jgi:mRNA-degrading endonuclease RelE of RelBE toxin-antitoxin system
MSYKVNTLPFFDKQLKRLVKKYPSLKKEYAELVDTLTNQPNIGTSLGNDCFKIRLAIASKGKGKSGGARVVTCLQVVHKTVYLLSIYDKGEQENISDTELLKLVSEMPGL